MDLISRNALLDAMPKNDELFSLDVRRIICEAPAVDAKPVRHGMWIFNRALKDKCSVCGFFCGSHDNDCADMYCSHCGAKMDGGSDDD